MNNNAMYNLSYGLFVLSAKENLKDNGCIVNTVIQVTTEPNRIAVAVNKQNYTHGMVERTGEFNVSILSESSDFETFKHWGFQSGADVDKTAGLNLPRTQNGIVYISENCNAVISAKVVSRTDLGTHTLFIADVTDAELISDQPSATYAYYHKNIKTAPPKTPKKKGFVCSVCGYVYEGETLPADFVCPWCKHPATDFKPI